jgi:hypothetical protein
MSSFFDEASLVMIPSGYKDQKVYSVKPLDGSGDLTFSRASSATRVASNGLIEKVRTNLLTYSQDFSNADWIKVSNGTGVNPVVTANNATAPDGTLTADTIVFNAGAGTSGSDLSTIYQTLSLSGTIFAGSFYARVTSGTGELVFRHALGGSYTKANLTTTWQRFSSAEAFGGGTQYFEIGIRRGVNEPVNASVTVQMWGAQLEVGDIATDYIATTSAAVSVGPVSGLPRLDYLNSTCPRLLLEPQRSNLITFSEQFNNATWELAGASVTANNAVSPDGSTNADLLTADGANSIHDIYESFSGGATNSVSIFVKKGTGRYVNVVTNYTSTGTDWVSVVFDLDTLTSNVDQSGGLTSSSVKIESYGNGWYRLISNTAAASSTTLYAFYGIVGTANPTRDSRGRVPLTSSATLNLYGAQAEVGAYATSYIPTLGTSVTRVADAASKTSATALIGQTEGTLFVEINSANLESYTQRIFTASDDTNNNVIGFQLAAANQITFYVENGGANQVAITKASPAITLGQNVKIAAAYKANDFVLYVNGIQVGTDSSGSVPATSVLRYANPTGTNPYIGKIAQTLLFKTRLSNSDLAALTA